MQNTPREYSAILSTVIKLHVPFVFKNFFLSVFEWPLRRGFTVYTKIVSEYDQEIPQSQTADNPMAPRGRAAQPSRDTRKTN